jgi:hypothetical protein
MPAHNAPQLGALGALAERLLVNKQEFLIQEERRAFRRLLLCFLLQLLFELLLRLLLRLLLQLRLLAFLSCVLGRLVLCSLAFLGCSFGRLILRLLAFLMLFVCQNILLEKFLCGCRALFFASMYQICITNVTTCPRTQARSLDDVSTTGALLLPCF